MDLLKEFAPEVLLDKRGSEFFRHMGYYSAKELSEKLTSD